MYINKTKKSDRFNVKKLRSQTLTDVEHVPLARYSGGQASNSQCCPSFVSYHEIRRTALRIFPKLGMKSEGDNVRTVTRPDFPGKF